MCFSYSVLRIKWGEFLKVNIRMKGQGARRRREKREERREKREERREKSGQFFDIAGCGLASKKRTVKSSHLVN